MFVSSPVLHPLRCRPRAVKERRGATNAPGCPAVAEQWENWGYKAASDRSHSSSCCCSQGLFWSHEVGTPPRPDVWNWERRRHLALHSEQFVPYWDFQAAVSQKALWFYVSNHSGSPRNAQGLEDSLPYLQAFLKEWKLFTEWGIN